MTARSGLLAVATAAGWLALALAAVTSQSTPLVAVLAGLLSLASWHRHGRAVAVAVPVGCVVLLASASSVLLAAAAGVLVLVQLVLADVAADAHGARRAQLRAALSPLVPGGVAAAVVAVLVAAAALIGARAPTAVVAPAVLAGPLLVLAAVLLALGRETRRDFWRMLTPRRRLSALTRRYVERAGGRS